MCTHPVKYETIIFPSYNKRASANTEIYIIKVYMRKGWHTEGHFEGHLYSYMKTL